LASCIVDMTIQEASCSVSITTDLTITAT
jgi:hypothetical protein